MFSKYPVPNETELEIAKNEALNESVADLDFWFQTDEGFATAVDFRDATRKPVSRPLGTTIVGRPGSAICPVLYSVDLWRIPTSHRLSSHFVNVLGKHEK